jgi:hypothetical protein
MSDGFDKPFDGLTENIVAERVRAGVVIERTLARAVSVTMGDRRTTVTYKYDKTMTCETGDQLIYREVCPTDAEWIGKGEAPRVPEVA